MTDMPVIINVKDFGALGDGKTDDSAALRAASYALRKAGGGRLEFPPGIYRIDESAGIIFEIVTWSEPRTE